jgi:very-short-patch-repair endonuclease
MGIRTQRARQLRRNQTQEEEILWFAFRDRKFEHKVRRQKPIGNFIVDFYCHEAKLAIEIDGDHHREFDDDARDAQLNAIGVKVLRFTNTQVRENVFLVIAAIKRELDRRVKERTGSSRELELLMRGEGDRFSLSTDVCGSGEGRGEGEPPPRISTTDG